MLQNLCKSQDVCHHLNWSEEPPSLREGGQTLSKRCRCLAVCIDKTRASAGEGWTDKTARLRSDGAAHSCKSRGPLAHQHPGKRSPLPLGKQTGAMGPAFSHCCFAWRGKCLTCCCQENAYNVRLNDMLWTRIYLWLPILDSVSKLWQHKGQKMQLLFSADFCFPLEM